MKKLIFLFTIIGSLCLISRTSDAQSPEWSWATSAGGVHHDEGRSLAMDASGNAYVTGYFYSPTITFGSNILTNAGSYDVFIVKYDANGNVLWATSPVGTDCDGGISLALDASGNAYVTGWFDSPTITFGSYALTNAGKYDMFLAKMKSGNSGINKVYNTVNISGYPNPATSTITIETPVKGSLSINNISGQQLLQQEITEPKTTINVSGLSTGVYMLKVVGKDRVQVGKFVKK